MTVHRPLPVACSLLLLAVPAATSLAQGPLPPAYHNSEAPLGRYAQAAPLAPPANPGVPTSPTDTATPAPIDPNAPAPIAPPPVLNGQPAGAPAAVAPPATDVAAANTANAAGPRAREFQGDDVGQVLRLLARQARINLIVSPQIVGTINMRLEDVTALQAIQIICQAQSYDLLQTNGVYFVKTAARARRRGHAERFLHVLLRARLAGRAAAQQPTALQGRPPRKSTNAPTPSSTRKPRATSRRSAISSSGWTSRPGR